LIGQKLLPNNARQRAKKYVTMSYFAKTLFVRLIVKKICLRAFQKISEGKKCPHALSWALLI
jgi:hypothetical protein